MRFPQEIVIDGVRVDCQMIGEIVYILAHPDPRKTYRFERIDDHITVHMSLELHGPTRKKCAGCGYHTTVAIYTHCPLDGLMLIEVKDEQRGSGSSGQIGKEAEHP